MGDSEWYRLVEPLLAVGAFMVTEAQGGLFYKKLSRVTSRMSRVKTKKPVVSRGSSVKFLVSKPVKPVPFRPVTRDSRLPFAFAFPTRDS